MRLAYRNPSRRFRLATGLLLAFLACLIFTPSIARADYSIDNVDIDATVGADGSVQVCERRTFSFDDSYNGVYWKLPKGQADDGREIGLTIDSVALVPDPQQEGAIDFQQVESAQNGMDAVFEESDFGSYEQVKLYHPVEQGEHVTYQITYTDVGLAVRHEDVSELYWKFVSDGWDVPSKSVTCTIRLPVPEGATLIHDGSDDATVRAWGHGPLDGSVDIADDGTITYRVPEVGTQEFAEARVTFPAEWLSAARSDGRNVLSAILSEERQQADEANHQRQQARLRLYGAFSLTLAVSATAIVIAFVIWLRYRRAHRPHFDDRYFRDVPSDDHPAVLGALLRGGTPDTQDLTASLMRLTDEKLVTLEKAEWEASGLLGRKKRHEEYRLVRTDREPGQGPQGKIDAATLKFLFSGIAPLAAKDDEGRPSAPEGARTLWLSDVQQVAKRFPQRYADLYQSWSDEVAAACITRRFFIEEHPVPRWPLVLMEVLAWTVFIFSVSTEAASDAPGAWILASIIMAVAAFITCNVLHRKMKELSGEAVEILARLDALKRWLKDFTRLKEAMPSDVILWNRLLVMAVVLGVSKEVIDQLKVAAPQVLEDPAIMPVYRWYWLGSPMGSPFDAFDGALTDAHQVSAAALARSANASSSGAGGGFSGGGGGGFGGGGGGGAF